VSPAPLVCDDEGVHGEMVPSSFDRPADGPPVRHYDLHSAAFLALLVSGVCLLLAIGSRFTSPMLIAFVISAGGAILVRLAANHFAPRGRGPGLIDISGLDQPAREMFCRAQAAITAVIGSDLYAAGQLDSQATELELRGQERDLAGRLASITDLQESYDASCRDGRPGPESADRLSRHRRELRSAQDSVTSWVAALERYADEVERADEAHHDLQLAQRLERLDGRYLDLAARGAADEHATATIGRMTDEVTALGEAFRFRA
jgi:hypothetical protein